jgi:hypothetical protein
LKFALVQDFPLKLTIGYVAITIHLISEVFDVVMDALNVSWLLVKR